jgi:hypothetical protein
MSQQGINHGIANKKYPGFRMSFMGKVFIGFFRGSKKIIRDTIGYDAVDFFGHRPIARPDTRFDMGYFDSRFFGHDGAGHRRIDISDDNADVRHPFGQGFLITGHDMSGLGSLCSGASSEVDVWVRDIELLEKAFAHIPVIVLASMNEPVLYFLPPLFFIVCVDGLNDGADLHEIGAGAGDEVEVHS